MPRTEPLPTHYRGRDGKTWSMPAGARWCAGTGPDDDGCYRVVTGNSDRCLRCRDQVEDEVEDSLKKFVGLRQFADRLAGDLRERPLHSSSVYFAPDDVFLETALSNTIAANKVYLSYRSQLYYVDSDTVSHHLIGLTRDLLRPAPAPAPHTPDAQAAAPTAPVEDGIDTLHVEQGRVIAELQRKLITQAEEIRALRATSEDIEKEALKFNYGRMRKERDELYSNVTDLVRERDSLLAEKDSCHQIFDRHKTFATQGPIDRRLLLLVDEMNARLDRVKEVNKLLEDAGFNSFDSGPHHTAIRRVKEIIAKYQGLLGKEVSRNDKLEQIRKIVTE